MSGREAGLLTFPTLTPQLLAEGIMPYNPDTDIDLTGWEIADEDYEAPDVDPFPWLGSRFPTLLMNGGY